MQWDLHSIGTDKFFSNKMFTITKTYNNTYRLNMNASLLNEMKDLISTIDGGSGKDTGADDKDDSDGDHGGKSGKSVAPNGKSGRKIGGNWTYSNLPQKYKDAIKLPKFDPKYLAGSPFVNTGDTGQCTDCLLYTSPSPRDS